MKTVAVRIPVAVDDESDWCVGSNGSRNTGMTERECLGSTKEFAEMIGLGHHHVVWITAEVPISEPVEVEGRAEE